jgi:hypothetical protein
MIINNPFIDQALEAENNLWQGVQGAPIPVANPRMRTSCKNGSEAVSSFSTRKSEGSLAFKSPFEKGGFRGILRRCYQLKCSVNATGSSC